ncbi:MAG TPA: S1 RNA-binding domain-containing protein [Planctomycetes bacterium]|nr:S1 RNA-binding domain-containing protein [Planctomycetota bacterium]
MQSDSRASSLRAALEEELRTTGSLRTSPSGLLLGQVVDVTSADVVVELGPRTSGIVPRDEFKAAPDIGKDLEVTVTGREDGLWMLSVEAARKLATAANLEVGSLVKGKVIGFNKGGLELKVEGLDAFLPASQIAMHHVEDLAAYAGETLLCEVLEIDRDRNRIVLSRRAVLEAEARREREHAGAALTEGAICRGKVTRIEPFGAFVDLGGIEGLLHVSNISHQRVEHPEEKLAVGQDVEVQILRIEEGGKRIGLGMKQLETDPWDEAAERLRPDSIVTGTVRRIADYGAFVEVLPGIDGLLHVSQLGVGRVQRVGSVVSVGDEVTVRVISVDPVARRISLSRLDPRGALIGSEEAAAGEEIEEVLRSDSSIGTNLGALFKKALDK